MKHLVPGLIGAALAVPALAAAAPAATVTNGNNDGPGSLRAALSSSADKIVIKPSVTAIAVTETLEYTGLAPVTIIGSGQTIDGAGMTDPLTPIFAVTRGADLTMKGLAFDGGGGYSRSLNLTNSVAVSGGKGIFVDVPENRTGTVKVRLTNVSVLGTGNHGIHVSDCTLGDDCGGGGGGGGDGSPASIEIKLRNVLVDGAGFGKQDADGLRVDDRNDGDIVVSIVDSVFRNVGADGVELDEGNDGSVILDVRNTRFDGNGAYCADGPFIAGDPCDDDGDPDVDDGFDVDEAGAGSVTGRLVNLKVSGNYDEGLDFDEEGAGGFDLALTNILAMGNEDEGVKISEQNDGDVEVSLQAVTLSANNGDKEDIEVEEEDAGGVDIRIDGSLIDGIKVSEDGSGSGEIRVRGSTIVEPLDLDDVQET